MTNAEFSNEFDVLYNSITSNQAPGLDEYEKSVFLTKAQSDIIREYFNSRVDATNGGFDGSQKRQYDFSGLIKTNVAALIASTPPAPLNPRAKYYAFPEDYFLSINEGILVGNTDYYSVISISYADYEKLMQKPYPYPPKKAVWRIFTNVIKGTENGNTVSKVCAEIIGKFPADTGLVYKIRYVKKPNPIILVDLSGEGLTIEGKSTKTECELPSQLHKEILEKAVTLAKITYQAGTTSTLADASSQKAQQ